MSATERPVDTISQAAGQCYGKGDTVSLRRVLTCFASDHMSVFEHASVSLKVEGISRACMAQLTRHRLMSFCVESQRYCKYDLGGTDWYVTPPSMEQTVANGDGQSFADAAFHSTMRIAADDYRAALDLGIKPEDARYLLPEATKTNLVMTCNVRQLFHVLDMRSDGSAQWEIRALAKAIDEACRKINTQWRAVMELRD